EIPPPVFGREHRPRRPPFILSDEQISQLIQLAAQSGYRTLRRQTYSTLFALLSCTGLRISEAIRLRYQDITSDGVVIRATKFRKSRLVPLHETARAGLERYLQKRRPYALFDDHVFISLRRKPLREADVDTAFRTVVAKMGLPTGRRQRHPTPHSLRHAFAVRALQPCRAMLHLTFAAGLRVSELVSLRLEDLTLHPQASILVHGKGRKERCLPLWKQTAAALRAWLAVREAGPAPEL